MRTKEKERERERERERENERGRGRMRERERWSDNLETPDRDQLQAMLNTVSNIELQNVT